MVVVNIVSIAGIVCSDGISILCEIATSGDGTVVRTRMRNTIMIDDGTSGWKSGRGGCVMGWKFHEVVDVVFFLFVANAVDVIAIIVVVVVVVIAAEV